LRVFVARLGRAQAISNASPIAPAPPSWRWPAACLVITLRLALFRLFARPSVPTLRHAGSCRCWGLPAAYRPGARRWLAPRPGGRPWRNRDPLRCLSANAYPIMGTERQRSQARSAGGHFKLRHYPICGFRPAVQLADSRPFKTFVLSSGHGEQRGRNRRDAGAHAARMG